MTSMHGQSLVASEQNEPLTRPDIGRRGGLTLGEYADPGVDGPDNTDGAGVPGGDDSVGLDNNGSEFGRVRVRWCGVRILY